MSYNLKGGYDSTDYEADIQAVESASGGGGSSPVTITSVESTEAGNQLIFNFSDNITGHSGYTAKINGVDVTLVYASGDGTNAITFSFSGNAAFTTENITWDYTPGDSVDDSALTLSADSGTAVNNSTNELPTLLSASIDGTTKQITLSFNQAVTVNLSNGISMTVDNVAGESFSSVVSGNGTDTVVLAWTTLNVIQGSSVKLSGGNAAYSNVSPLPVRTSSAFTNFSVTNATITVPTRTSWDVATNGTTFNIQFSEAVTGASPATLQVNGSPIVMNYVSGDGTSSRVYSITTLVKATDTVGYATFGTNAFYDSDMNYYQDVTTPSVTNNSIQVDPAVLSSSINNSGDVLTINYNQAVDSPTNTYTGFALSTGETLTYASGAGTSTWTYNIGTKVLQSATPTLQYTPGDLRGVGNNLQLASFSGASITNTSGVTIPTYVSSSVDTSGTQLTIVYSESVTDTSASYSLSTGQSLTLTSGNGSTTLVYSLSGTILGSDSPNIALTGGSLQSTAYGVQVANYGPNSVTNNSQLPVPQPTTASYDGGSQVVTVNFDNNISVFGGGSPTTFNVLVNSGPVWINLASAMSNYVTLDIGGAGVNPGDLIVVYYTAGNLIGQYGSPVASFGPLSVSNP